MLAVLLILASFAQLSEECNSRGLFSALKGSCNCCKTEFCGEQFGIIGTYVGDFCEEISIFVSADFGVLFNDNVVSVTCPNDGSSSVPNFVDLLTNITSYGGLIRSDGCKVCTQASPCTEFENTLSGHVDEPATSGILVMFRTYFSTFYDHSCPEDANNHDCDENYDDGQTAKIILEADLTGNDFYEKVELYLNKTEAASQMFYQLSAKTIAGATRTRQPTPYPTKLPTQLPTPSPTQSPTPLPTQSPTPSPTNLPTPSPTHLPTPSPTHLPTPSPTHLPTPSPTTMPTELPTQSPSPSPTKVKTITTVCEPFSHKINNFRHVDMGVGASCRGGISESWPGARTCKSPYLICLPEENTPADSFLGRTYFNDTHRYTVDECKRECRFDQRCRGFEFVADTESNLGSCILIDDVAIIVVDRPTPYEFAYTSNLSNLDSTVTGGDAICFEKFDICNPYFNASELSETMLSCYCPNNRKGSYTKKVKRTVSNTRYCGSDSEMDERIKLAHANRMFHLCENWCLFNTLNPEQESWYWDPWNTCWYETYSGPGAHRAYCDRVIRNPDSIELQFVNRRAQNLISCNKTMIPPTLSPVEDVNVKYLFSAPAESCDDACAAKAKTCAAEQTARVFSSETELTNVFLEAGFTCKSDDIVMNRTNWQGWALPGLGYGHICANRLPTLSHLEDLDSDCNRKIGNGWQRLCACY